MSVKESRKGTVKLSVGFLLLVVSILLSIIACQDSPTPKDSMKNRTRRSNKRRESRAMSQIALLTRLRTKMARRIWRTFTLMKSMRTSIRRKKT